jgi:hypothetical protein
MHRFLVISLSLAATLASGAETRVQFNRDIRPILSDKCFFCHGPDPAHRDGKLRLDIREDAVKAEAIVPGDAAKSKLVERLFTSDSDDLMPPPKSKRTLTDAQKQTLKRWIEQGAEYQNHWSFIPPKMPALAGRGGASPIDELVTQSLAKRGLALQPQASPETLIRRLSFDLTGLPPTPQEVEVFTRAFTENPASSVQHLVSTLLASPHYGERMAVDWLDVSRYADSYGYQVDRERDVWMWRDWVVKAFNENLSFDKFATWQIAGDLLPNPTDEQRLATAFCRLHQQESEGGSVEEEYRVEYVCDRVQTFATAFLGLSFECSRCHDHKFDPIKQKDYYGLFAMFQNIDEAGLYSFFAPSPPTPALMLMDQPAKDKMASLRARIAELENSGASLREGRREAFAAWLKSRPREVTLGGELGRFSFDALEKDNKFANAIKDGKPATLKGGNTLVPGVHGNAVQFTGDDPVDLAIGNFKRHEPFSVSLWMKTPDVKDRAVVFHRSRAWTDSASRGYELLIEGGKLKWSLIHFWPGDAISIRAKALLPVNAWTHVTVTNDGSSRAAGLRLYVNGQPAEVDIIRDHLTKDLTGDGGDNITLGERFRDRGFKGGAVDDFRVFNREVTSLEALALHDEGSVAQANDSQWFDYYLATADSNWQKHLEALKTARGEQAAFAEGVKEIMTMREMPQPKISYILNRGQYDAHKDEVPMRIPDWIAPMPKGAPMNRLGLAQWLTSPEHPLFARVIVNRLWQSLFGYGLVKTAADFGSQGTVPEHPELLDWLALEFRRNGWDVKALLTTIVMSKTYQQRSIADAKTMADDPDNDWLARGPRFRLPAEMIRDNALAASGLLKDTIGGPPVQPYEMSEAFKPVNASAGDGVYRRSLYTNWRRTSPPPAMLAFDAPRRAICIAKRERTDSPLQALILLNGVQYVEAARVLGEKLYKDTSADTSQMIEQGFLRCLSRKPDTREIAIMEQLYTEQLQHFKTVPKDAEEFLKGGNTKHDASIPAPEAAAATVLAQALMNHDACVVKR